MNGSGTRPITKSSDSRPPCCSSRNTWPPMIRQRRPAVFGANRKECDMADQYDRDDRVEGVRSKASIMGHPIHPMIIPFPIAFLVGLFVTDIVYLATEDRFWAHLSFW